MFKFTIYIIIKIIKNYLSMKRGIYLKQTLIINNLNETILLGKILSSSIHKKAIIALDGDLGCGKTHLTKGIALGLNINDNIKSPTFNLINEYLDGKTPLYHFDVYRLNSIDELFLIGFDEYLKNDGIKVIEWASLIKEVLPKDTNYINIFKIPHENDKRKIEFNFSKDFEEVLKNTIDKFKKEVKNDSSNS